MKSKNLLMFVVLSAAIVTALTATIGTSLISTVYADKKHCEDNGDDNCNHTENNQKLSPKDECNNENATNLRDSVLLNSTVFGDVVAPEFQ